MLILLRRRRLLLPPPPITVPYWLYTCHSSFGGSIATLKTAGNSLLSMLPWNIEIMQGWGIKVTQDNNPTLSCCTFTIQHYTKGSHFKERTTTKKYIFLNFRACLVKYKVLTTAWTVFPETITVQTHPKATFATNPVNIEQCCFTYITHLPHTTYSSLPRHFFYKNKHWRIHILIIYITAI